ncbi:amino acid adenylation domain-containing protein [Streptomyces sp. NPDC026673]|uniref:non-ribosomal peptide synthetase n=1 Tax=Streptomyces sp. NPDC026673 TaxID=3155724 RepID=UPI0033CBE759
MTSVYDLFRAQVERVPDATAVIAGEHRTTYRELAALAARFAGLLSEPAGGLVGVCLGRDERLPAALLAVWRAGCGYVPLDPALPLSRLTAMVKQAGLREVLTTEEAASTVAATGATPVLVDDGTGAVPAEESGDRTVPAGDGTAYVLFTSGSTGTPKGVVIEHASVVALLDWVAGSYDPQHLRAGLASASISFDQSVLQIFGPLTTGGTVVLADDILALPTLPARDEITMIGATPSALATLLEQPLPRGIRRVNIGAEAVTRPLVDRVYAQPGVETVVNVYGPTECTVACSVHVLERDGGDSAPIGAAIAGGELTVRDAGQRPVADGEPGELWVAGPLVGRGYLGAPELTAQRFVDDPASPGGRRYRTGDLVRRVDGVLHYLGRIDDQVKIRGFRVELGEVEAALLRHPGVRHAVAVAREDADGTRVLHAYAEAPVPDGDLRVDEDGLLRHLRGELPQYMVPSRIMVVDALPQTTNRKVDRSALPPMPAAPVGAPQGDPYEAPRDGVEERVAAVIAAVLELPRVGRTDRFDTLGGHSLAAAKVVARVRAELGVAVSPGDFLTEPTVAALASRVAGAAEAPVPLPVRDSGSARVPLTDMQRQLWTTRQVSGFPGVTAEAFAIGIVGRVGTAELIAALDSFAARHEALRTVVREPAPGAGGTDVPDVPGGEVRPAAPVPFTEHDARTLTADETQALVDRAARQTFAPDEDVPLLRATLVRTADDAARLVIAVDHLAFDGWSAGILLEELAAHLAGAAPVEPALQPGDVARWEQEVHAAADRAARAFWDGELTGARPPYALARRARTGPSAQRGTRLVRPLAAETAQAVRRLGASAGLGEFAVYLAALDVLLGHWTGDRDVLVGVPAVRRDLVELEGVVGPLLAVLPVRVRWEPGQTFRSVAALATLARNRTLRHPDLSADALSAAADSAGVARLPGVPLTPVTLSVRPAGAPVRARAGAVELTALGELDTGAAPNEATFLVNETAAGTEIHLVHDVERFDAEAAAALLDGFLRVLTEGVAEPDRPCSAIVLPEPPPVESPAAPAADRAQRRTEPTGVIEEFLADVWTGLLGTERVTASDSFFELGGTSLTAIRMTREVHDALGVQLPVRSVFELPVLIDLAAEVERHALALLDAEGGAR